MANKRDDTDDDIEQTKNMFTKLYELSSKKKEYIEEEESITQATTSNNSNKKSKKNKLKIEKNQLSKMCIFRKDILDQKILPAFFQDFNIANEQLYVEAANYTFKVPTPNFEFDYNSIPVINLNQDTSIMTCKHQFETQSLQIRSSDEIYTVFKKCKICSFVVKT
uniref:LEF-5 n=1 Tax=Faxonius propinquus nudivirus TaxID=3139431 RepID=A0AAU8GC90_9VIRU